MNNFVTNILKIMKNFLLDDPFYFTLLLIIAVFIVGVISKARNKDRCLKHFKNHLVSIENIRGKIITSGILKIKSTGIKIIFPKQKEIENKYKQSTYLIYKYEFDQLQSIIINLENLNERGKKIRNKKFSIIRKPGFFRKIIRNIRNIFNSLKESFIEVMNISLSYITTKQATVLKPHDQYVKNLNTELMESMGISHDPLIEKYIGKYVIFELLKGNEKIILKGILYDYTKKFIEILNIDYTLPEEERIIKADMILPQKFTIIRGLCEQENSKFFDKYFSTRLG